MPFKPGQGGRPKGAKNKLTLARMQLRQEALRRLNEDLPADAFDGDAIELFQRIYRDPNFDPELRLEAAAKIAAFERKDPATDGEPQFLVRMPPPMPGSDQKGQLAVWWALYGDVPAGNDPEWDNAVKLILERAATKIPPGTLS